MVTNVLIHKNWTRMKKKNESKKKIDNYFYSETVENLDCTSVLVSKELFINLFKRKEMM
jgi:hypothetical protein